MDLQISAKSAIVCGASKGLGKACGAALAAEGVNVLLVARGEQTLATAEAEIAARSTGEVRSLAADVTTEAGRDAIFAACPHPDILVNNAGGPPPGNFRDWGQEEWFTAVNNNMYSAIDMIKRCLDGMIDRRFGRILNITSVAVKQPVDGLGLSNGARAGLTGFISSIARDPCRYNVTINNLLPGYIATDRLKGLHENIAKQKSSTAEEVASALYKTIPAQRPGDPDEFGATCAFLCSQQAAYITAQNILIDGGLYPGTL